jgi:hypothetical protein
VDGFSGTVGTGWGGDYPNSIAYKSVDGDRSGGTREPFVLIVVPMISRVGLVNGRRFCSGPMIRLYEKLKELGPWTQGQYDADRT